MDNNSYSARSGKNIFLFFTGTFLAFINFYTALTLLPLYVVKLGGNEFDTGMQTTIFYLASIMMRFYFGPLTDRRGRKLPLLIGTFVFGTAPLLFMFSPSVGVLTLARIYHAVGLACFFSSGSSLVADIAPAKRVGVYIGIYRVIFTLALLSGPATALYVVDVRNFNTWFLISFFIGLASLISLAFVQAPPSPGGEKVSSLDRFKAILTSKIARQIYFGIVVASIGYGILLTFAVLFITQVSSVKNPAFYFTCYSLAGVAGNVSAGYFSDRFGRPVVAWPLVIVLGIGVAALFFLPGFSLIFVISSFLAGFGYSGGSSVLIAWLVEVTDQTNRGTALALQESTVDFGIAVGSGIFGSVTGWIGMGNSFLALGLAVVIAALAFFFRFLMERRSIEKIKLSNGEV